MVEFVEEIIGERRYSYHSSLQIKEETLSAKTWKSRNFCLSLNIFFHCNFNRESLFLEVCKLLEVLSNWKRALECKV